MPTFQRLLDKFANYPARSGWYTKVIPDITSEIRHLLKHGSAVIIGGVTTGGTVSASALGVTTTALNAKTNGQLKAQLAALSDADLFTTTGGVGQAIFSDGADASGISLATDETAHVTLIAADSDGSGDHTGDTGDLLYVAVVAGTDSTYAAASAPLTDGELRSALRASEGVHDGTTGFVRLSNILWDENSGSPEATVTVARDA